MVATLLSLLAVLFFANAPIQATTMALAADGDALCAVHTGGGGDHKSPVDRQAACGACAICQVGGVALLTPGPALPHAPIATPLVRSVRPASSNPRGPPSLVPWARGPPALS